MNIASKVSATGVLYGSVNAAQVAAELANKGITIDRKRIIMKDIKTVGEYVATVVFHKEVKVELPVVVTAENAQPAAVEETAEEAVEAAPVEEAPVVEAEAPVAE